jgi:ribonuclease D
VDLETTGLNPWDDRVRLISLATAQDTWLIDCFEVDPSSLFPVLAEKKLAMHNGQFDLGFLFEMGFEIAEGGGVIDTMLVSQILGHRDLEEDKEAA